LHQFKRLRTRSEVRADLHQGLLELACSIICLRRLRRSF
ncbi:IS5/IS1182 family transposase, partial [Nocardia cyriacigeorgica]|nr:IS5/IS1182 family transposase [Nocardia cyriacigeorgica]MBF6290233.1 IS5/IS1182 family transposase [Nocardia cyriacigeorgica]